MKRRSLEFLIQKKLEKKARLKGYTEVPVEGGGVAKVPREGLARRMGQNAKYMAAGGAILSGGLNYVTSGGKKGHALAGALGGAVGGYAGGSLGARLGAKIRPEKHDKRLDKYLTRFDRFSKKDVQFMKKFASTADAMAEGEVSSSDNDEKRQRYGEVWDRDDPGGLGSPSGANLIDPDDKTGIDGIYAGEPEPHDPYGIKLRDAIKAKVINYHSENVDQVVRNQSNQNREYL